MEDGGRDNAKALPPRTLYVHGDEKAPKGLLHFSSLGHLKVSYMPQISEDDITRKELRQKGCGVETRG